MRNPLFKRLPREFKSDFGKYVAVFLFMTLTIGFVSGFLVADDSMLAAYNESFEKYNVEHGNFTYSAQASEKALAHIEETGQVHICENFYLDLDMDKDADGISDATLRIYQERTDMDLVCLMKGEMPADKTQIAIDRMFADNNSLSVGDTILVDGKNLTVSGLVALSDYSCLFSDNNDMMFDAVKFGVAIMNPEGFKSLGTSGLTFRYSWQYNTPPINDIEEKEMSEDFLKVLASNGTLTGFIPGYLNQALHFTGDDMGSDKAMMEVLLYILIAIMAFVFGVTTNSTIAREASVIGTLRASGYTRKELLFHYISLPILVTLLSALLGNISGYTLFKRICADMYYGSYSLPTYQTRWNADAFLLTTLVPLGIMAVINICLVSAKLKLSPLRFLRHDLSRHKRQKTITLPNFKFFNRFRLRIILQNRSSFLTLFVGILFANILLLFGMMMSPLLSHYQEETVANMLAPYQYILSTSDELSSEEKHTLLGTLQTLLAPSLKTRDKTAERFCMDSLKYLPDGKNEGEAITVYGIQPDSSYVSVAFPKEGVLLSDGYLEKYKLHVGDTITLKESYGDETYTFTVGGSYSYPGALAVFLPMDDFRKVFGKSADYFNAYFAKEPLTDLDEDVIGTTITEDDLTKISRQLNVSMGSMFYLINVFSIILFTLLLYLLTKLIIEKNASAISMVKILGYTDKEILSLYLTATTWVVIFSQLLSLVAATYFMKAIYTALMEAFSGWLTFYIKPAIYPEMFLMGIAAYGIVAALQFRRIRHIPKEEALKNVE